MTTERSRRWEDRDGRAWEIVHDPSVELDTRRDRRLRERLVFRAGDERFDAPAVFGRDLEALSDSDLQGLLDQARAEQLRETSAWERTTDRGASP